MYRILKKEVEMPVHPPITEFPPGVPIDANDLTDQPLAACSYLIPFSNDQALFLFFKTPAPANSIRCNNIFAYGPPILWSNSFAINGRDQTPQAVAACQFGESLYLFWAANDRSNLLYDSVAPGLPIVNWPNGISLPTGRNAKRITTALAPAACVFNNQLYVFWVASDNSIQFSNSPFNYDWPGGKPINAVDATNQPVSACVYGNAIFLFWTDAQNRIMFSSSLDGLNWPAGKPISNLPDKTPAAPSACVFRERLYVFWRANDPSNGIYFSQSFGGGGWPNGNRINNVDSTPMAPTACASGAYVYLFWKASGSNQIFFTHA
jgi:hypothetical protein